MTLTMPDHILNKWVASAAAGEGRAWNNLYRQFYPGMYAIALRICRHGELASDVVQDAFITCYLKLSQLHDSNRFGAWLKQIVVHTCYRSLSANRNYVPLDEFSLEQEYTIDTEMSNRMDSLANKYKLHAVLAALPEILHSTILLRYFSNFKTYEEIASVLKIPVGTVRSRLNEAKKKLSSCWQTTLDVGNEWFRESEEWNAFYYSMYGGMHEDDSCKNRFVEHLRGGCIITSNGRQRRGCEVIEHMVQEDRQVGSRLEPVNIFSSGVISIIESVHFNSIDHPDHCPASSVMVLYHERSKASRIMLHAPIK